MLKLDSDWNLREWYDWLEEEMGLTIGRDYKWAWQDRCWGIVFNDPRVEIMVRLRAPMS
jgi:hypothetical protein